MKLNLNRPLCFFDLETTGINITKDRIVEIGILKIFPDGGVARLRLWGDVFVDWDKISKKNRKHVRSVGWAFDRT